MSVDRISISHAAGYCTQMIAILYFKLAFYGVCSFYGRDRRFFSCLASNAAELLKKYLIEQKYAKKIGSELAAHGRSLYYGATLR